MKNFLRPLKLACLAAASMLIVSCGGSADYRSILPADSFMTVSVNPASLMQKCEAGDLDQHPLYVRIKAELDKDQNLSAEEKEYLLALLKNPGESGIDVKKDFFFFAAMEGTVDAPVMRGGLLLPIGDKAKFDALLARINEKSGVAPETKGGVSVVDLGKEGDAGVLCAYNDIAFMVYFVQNGVDDLAGDVRKLFAQKSGESLMGDKAVAEQLARKNDVNMVLSYGAILPMMNNPMLSSMPMMDALKGATMVGSVNFEKGRIVTEAAVSYKDKESEAKMMDFYAYVKPQTGALLPLCAGRFDRRDVAGTQRRKALFDAFGDARLRHADGKSDGQAGDGTLRRRLPAFLLRNGHRRQISRGVDAGAGERSCRAADDRHQLGRHAGSADRRG